MKRNRSASEDVQRRTAVESALQMIARRALSRAEIATRLLRQGYERPAVDDALARLESMGYIDDRSFGLEWLSVILDRRPCGPLLLRRELLRKGIESDLAVSLVSEVMPPGEESKWAERACNAWLKRRKVLSQKAAYRLAAHLAQRGFEEETVKSVVFRLTQFEIE